MSDILNQLIHLPYSVNIDSFQISPQRKAVLTNSLLAQTGREINKSTLGDSLLREFDIAQEELSA